MGNRTVLSNLQMAKARESKLFADLQAVAFWAQAMSQMVVRVHETLVSCGPEFVKAGRALIPGPRIALLGERVRRAAADLEPYVRKIGLASTVKGKALEDMGQRLSGQVETDGSVFVPLGGDPSLGEEAQPPPETPAPAGG